MNWSISLKLYKTLNILHTFNCNTQVHGFYHQMSLVLCSKQIQSLLHCTYLALGYNFHHLINNSFLQYVVNLVKLKYSKDSN